MTVNAGLLPSGENDMSPVMQGGTRIISLGTGHTVPGAEVARDELLLSQEAEPAWDAPEDLESPYESAASEEIEPAVPSREWLLPAGALTALLAWTAFFAWANWPLLADAPGAARWAGLVSQWATPALLIGVAWLLIMRNSRREARRFGDAAFLLSTQSRQLEDRLATVNRELSLAREFIAAQSRDLDSLGRMATERLSQHAERLHNLIHENSARLDAIGAVSTAALENMDRLRGQLPVIASSAKDVTNNIGQAGRTAQTQVDQMVRGFERINEFGAASERQVDALRAMVDTARAELARQSDEFDQAMAARFAALDERGAALHARLEDEQAEAIGNIRARAAALAEELHESRKALDAHEAEMLVSLRSRVTALRDEGQAVARALREGESRAADGWQETVAGIAGQIAELDAEIARRHAAQAERIEGTADASRAIVEQLAHYQQQMADLAENAARASDALTESTAASADRIRASSETVTRLSGDLTGLTDRSVRLLELIRASAEHSRDDLPAALSAGEARLADLERRAGTLRGEVCLSHDQSEALGSQLAQSRERIAALAADLDSLQSRVSQTGSDHAEMLQGLRRALGELDTEGEAIARRAESQLSSALAELAEAARKATSDLADNSAPVITQLARQLGEESANAIDRAMRASAAETAGKLEQAVAHAAGASREAVIQLRDQLAKVNELAGNLERRVAQARERAEEQVDNDFSRRAALITESLNSNAIDIAKALSTDVSDMAWAAYLRGDRGIFTRRAVALLDGAETRAIAQIYETDHDFRDHVSRYIHDFEAMLRQVLSTRDGHALGVTLLSSDMGKLYVALAQGIERLRA